MQLTVIGRIFQSELDKEASGIFMLATLVAMQVVPIKTQLKYLAGTGYITCSYFKSASF